MLLVALYSYVYYQLIICVASQSRHISRTWSSCCCRTTGLIIAAEAGSNAFVQLMLAAGADVDAALGDGTTALFMAAQEGRDGAHTILLNPSYPPLLSLMPSDYSLCVCCVYLVCFADSLTSATQLSVGLSVATCFASPLLCWCAHRTEVIPTLLGAGGKLNALRHDGGCARERDSTLYNRLRCCLGDRPN